jgi:hypothetical protein
MKRRDVIAAILIVGGLVGIGSVLHSQAPAARLTTVALPRAPAGANGLITGVELVIDDGYVI